MRRICSLTASTVAQTSLHKYTTLQFHCQSSLFWKGKYFSHVYLNMKDGVDSRCLSRTAHNWPVQEGLCNRLSRMMNHVPTAARWHIGWTSVLLFLAARRQSSPCQLPQMSHIHCWRRRLDELSTYVFTIILFSCGTVPLAVHTLKRLILDHFWSQLWPAIMVTWADAHSGELLSSAAWPTSRCSLPGLNSRSNTPPMS